MDSVSSISESKAQTRVQYSRAEDSGSSAYAYTLYKVFVLDSSFVMLLYTIPVRKKATYEVIRVATHCR